MMDGMPGQGPLPALLLAGCGKMGGAMLSGWLERGVERVVVVEPHPEATAAFAGRVTVCDSVAGVPADFAPAAVILATKPQQADGALPGYERFAADDALFISIMAGKTVAGITASLGGHARVVRAMPNTPAAVRQGFTCAFPGPGVDAGQKALADTLLAAVGEVAWLEEEGLIDPVTAVSGGGPAYVFLLAEVMEAAAISQGLPPALARRMARRTVAGSGALLAASELDAAQLRANVTSPKGTTERALNVLMRPDAWPKLMEEAIAAATARSRELAG
ncbi:MAG: Pyrroline-5-carboxylate reductase [Roseomonas sp.]|nr:Pyrroline-5-carboxylate reductase [Roseomonas sp.]